jgi:hypothetical protein
VSTDQQDRAYAVVSYCVRGKDAYQRAFRVMDLVQKFHTRLQTWPDAPEHLLAAVEQADAARSVDPRIVDATARVLGAVQHMKTSEPVPFTEGEMVRCRVDATPEVQEAVRRLAGLVDAESAAMFIVINSRKVARSAADVPGGPAPPSDDDRFLWTVNITGRPVPSEEDEE